MPFCSQCGNRLGEATRFCGSCGTPVTANYPQPAVTVSPSNQSAPPAAPPVPQYHAQLPAQPAAGTGVLAMLPNAKKMKMMGLFDAFTVIFTQDRAIFARLSNEVIKDVIKRSQEQSKAEGKGMFARVGAQMKAFYSASNRYLTMTPEQIMAEDKNNFALAHASVASLKTRRGMSAGDDDGPGDPYVDVEWETQSGKFKFRFDQDEKDLLPALNHFYPGKIRK